MRKILSTIALVAFSLLAYAQDKVDSEAVAKIRQEGLENSQVMDIAFNLTDMSGNRLMNSKGLERAANYATSKLKSWGLTNVDYEKWGEFGKGWDLEKSYVAMTAPYYKPLIAYPKAWVKGSNGLQNAEILLVEAADTNALDAYKGQFRGKIVMFWNDAKLASPFEPNAQRHSDEELEKMANATLTPAQGGASQAGGDMRARFAQMRAAMAVTNKAKQLAEAEGALGFFSINPRGRDGTIFVQGGGAYQGNSPENPLDIVVGTEDYMTLSRLAKAGVKVKVEVDVKTTFHTDNLNGYNVIAEIEGSDSNLKDEIVMLGGHLDSWHGSTGATDNAAGSAVMMEAVRILKATGLKPKRTIRMALWSAEEQGLHGSRNYVANHFTDKETNWSNAAGEKVSAYYNLDNGTGKIRGIYLQENEKAGDIFAKWLEPFHDLDAKTVTVENTGGTDHLAFDRVGIPGFQFIQEPMEYSTRTHHTTMDSYDHLYEDDLKQAATIIASFVYHTAQREEKIPRKKKPTRN